MASERRTLAIAHAKRTTGTVLWCGVGVFSGDGKRAFDSVGSWNVSEETRRYLRLHCTRFTQHDQIAATHRATHQLERCKRLALKAICCHKFEAAVKLIHWAESLADSANEYRKGERVIYRINA